MSNQTLNAQDITPHDRLIDTVERCTDSAVSSNGLLRLPLEQPHVIRRALEDLLPGRVVVTGTIERRLLLIEHGHGERWMAVDLSGEAHATRQWPGWAADHLMLEAPNSWLSPAAIDEQGMQRLLHPRVLLTALYRPEIFPLPRFPLAISDLARAVRSTLTGRVDLLDMQLGASMDDLIAAIDENPPDILGVSATFGQHDLMLRLLDQVYGRP